MGTVDLMRRPKVKSRSGIVIRSIEGTALKPSHGQFPPEAARQSRDRFVAAALNRRPNQGKSGQSGS